MKIRNKQIESINFEQGSSQTLHEKRAGKEKKKLNRSVRQPAGVYVLVQYIHRHYKSHDVAASAMLGLTLNRISSFLGRIVYAIFTKVPSTTGKNIAHNQILGRNGKNSVPQHNLKSLFHTRRNFLHLCNRAVTYQLLMSFKSN